MLRLKDDPDVFANMTAPSVPEDFKIIQRNLFTAARLLIAPVVRFIEDVTEVSQESKQASHLGQVGLRDVSAPRH